MLFFWVLKGYIVWVSRRTYQAVKEALSCFLPIGPLPVSPGRPVSFWQQLLAACGGRGWAAQLQTSVGPDSGPPRSPLFLFRTHIHWSPQSAKAQRPHSYSLYWWRGCLKLPSSRSTLPPLFAIYPATHFSNSLSLSWSQNSSVQVSAYLIINTE